MWELCYDSVDLSAEKLFELEQGTKEGAPPPQSAACELEQLTK